MNVHLFPIIRQLLFEAMMVVSSLACAQQSSVSVKVNGVPSASAPAVARILEKRFDSLRPGIFDTVRTQTNADRVTVLFSGWSPSPEQTAYVIRTIGRFKVTLKDQRDDPLITEFDVADSRPSIRADRPELAIRLTDAAVAKVARRTRSAVGEEVTVEWEGRLLSRLRISGPLARDIALTAGSVEDVAVISAVLRGGRLPDGVVLTPVR
jgi:preprotein translocase subunit SecD